MPRPKIGFTLGDPGGIGPELILKTLLETPHAREFESVLFGSQDCFKHPALGVLLESVEKEIPFSFVETPVQSAPISIGQPSAQNGHHIYHSVATAIDWAMQGKISAIVTAPSSKESLHLAGYAQTDHTSLLKVLTGSQNVKMGFYSPRLKTVLATVHVALCKVPSFITKAVLHETLASILEFSAYLGIKNPKIAVAGLNPHAGENGLFGDEEIQTIRPFVAEAQGEGFSLSGPYPSDTLYHRAASGEFDFVLSLYHDQALIPIKLLEFGSAVNITLGLPFIRTSPDHGTAFDIAYQDKASTQSMHAALDLALTLLKESHSHAS